MPIWLHLILTVAAQMGGGFGSVVFVMSHVKQVEAWGINPTLAFIVSFLVGLIIPRLLFTYLIQARCPACGGPSVFHGGRPITYHCTSCGHVHRTSVSEGGHRRRHH